MPRKISRLKSVALRNVWPNEPKDFTPWLAKEENLSLLGEILDINLKRAKEEYRVGDFQVDILAEDEDSGDKIVIENQLTRTDHKHLGQLITYAADTEASAIIWIVEEARDKHRQAIEWLNQHTVASITFYLVKLSAWQIGNSDFAPKFELISTSDVLEEVKEETSSSGDIKDKPAISDMQQNQLKFWQGFKKSKYFSVGFGNYKPRAHGFFVARSGFSGCSMRLTIHSKNKIIKCIASFSSNGYDFYEFLNKNKRSVAAKLGGRIKMSGFNKGASIRIEREVEDVFDAKHHQEYYKWLADNLTQFQEVLGDYYHKYYQEEQDNSK